MQARCATTKELRFPSRDPRAPKSAEALPPSTPGGHTPWPNRPSRSLPHGREPQAIRRVNGLRLSSRPRSRDRKPAAPLRSELKRQTRSPRRELVFACGAVGTRRAATPRGLPAANDPDWTRSPVPESHAIGPTFGASRNPARSRIVGPAQSTRCAPESLATQGLRTRHLTRPL